MASAARAIPPPMLGLRSEEAALTWLKFDLASWVARRRPATEQAESEYLAALEHAPAERTAILREAAELWLEFAEQHIALATSAVSAMSKDPGARTYILERLVPGEAAGLLERAERLLEQCAGAEPGCRERLAAVRQKKQQPELDSSGGEDRKWRELRLAVPARDFLATTSPAPCVYRGSLKLGGGFAYAQPGDGASKLRLDEVEVDVLEMPTDRGQRFRVALSWPIVMEGLLDATALPLVTLERVPVKEPHLWLEPGARVFAWRTKKEGTATLGRPRSAKSLEGAFEAPIACKDLALPKPLPATSPQAFASGSLGVFRSKAGELVDRFDAGRWLGVDVLARDGEWTQVRGLVSASTPAYRPYIAFDFLGWTDAAIDDQTKFAGGFASPEVPPSHRAGAGLVLFARPGRGARALGKAAPGAPFRSGKTLGVYVAVKFKGVGPANVNSEFWVEANSLATQASRW